MCGVNLTKFDVAWITVRTIEGQVAFELLMLVDWIGNYKIAIWLVVLSEETKLGVEKGYCTAWIWGVP